MKLAIISDSHDNLVNLDKGLRIISAEKVSTILCCGDVTTLETLKHLRRNFSGEIFLVLGNMDIFSEDEARQVSGINVLGRMGVFRWADKLIGACHEPFYIDRLLTQNKNQKFDFIFYGHTHKPWIEIREGIKIINPGTLGGVFQKASLAILDDKSAEPELKILETINL
ncbi:MAG TPA: YfcE family phosphodiesterase [bacterium]|nr:YfcE family phosphodiesterase [bacterium]HPT29388.1 YfcE family phosphodiesterase [bacterium]